MSAILEKYVLCEVFFHTNSLRMDRPSLYHMMTRTDPIALDIFDFEGYVIQSEKGARRQRDAVFCFILTSKKLRASVAQLVGSNLVIA